METSVEPYKIDQFERSHGMVEAKLESFVNVCCRSDPLLEHIKRLVADHRIDTAGDEPRRILDNYYLLAHALPDFDRRSQGVIVSLEGTHNFEQLHLVHRVEEVHAQALLGAVGHAGNFRNAQR